MGEAPDNRKSSLPAPGDIAEMGARGDDFTSYYTRRCIAIKPIRRVNIHLSDTLLRGVDERAAELNLSREAAIHILLRQGLIRNPPPTRPPSGSELEQQ